MSSRTPSRKVTATALGGALATVLVWFIASFTTVEVTPPVVAAFATLLSFLAGYVTADE